MSRRFCAVLVIGCLGFAWAGCAWMKQKPSGEQIVMPLQTGSTLHRRVMVPRQSDQTNSASKKKESKKKKESNAARKKTETERASPRPSPKPVREAAKTTPIPKPKTPTAPERFR